MATLNESNTAREGSVPDTSGNVGNLNGMVPVAFVLNRKGVLRCSKWYREDVPLNIEMTPAYPNLNLARGNSDDSLLFASGPSKLRCHWALSSGSRNWFTDWRYHARLQISTSPPFDPRVCPSSLGIRSTPLPLPVDSPHLRLVLSSCSFPPTRNHTCNHPRKINSRSLSAHGLHMLPHSDSRHHHFFDMLMHSPRVPPSLANCSSLEVVYTDPGLQATIYMCSQHGISPQLSCRPAETFPAHVSHIVSCSPALPFWSGVGGRILVTRMRKTRAMTILFICSTSVRCTIFMSRPAPADQNIFYSSIARVDPHRGQWSWARRPLLSHHDLGRFQAFRLRWPDRQEVFK
jgi:hypothetical protein